MSAESLPTDALRICLSPKGALYVETSGPLEKSSLLASLRDVFHRDWREGILRSAAQKLALDVYPILRFWQSIGMHYLTRICHLPEEAPFSPLDAPHFELLNEWICKRPLMVGGEYLTTTVLEQIWRQLNLWIEKESASHGGIHAFLREWAPKWQQVGRVCFHLAENPRSTSRPFAFLATYATGFNIAGRLKHLPLKQALAQHSSQRNHQALAKLLTPVHEAATHCSWVKILLDSAKIYQPLVWSVDQAHAMLKSIPQLEASGLSVRVPNWWKGKSLRPQVSVTIDSPKQETLSLHAMLDFQIEVALGGAPLSEEELHQLTHAKEPLLYLRGQWVEIDREKFNQTLQHWERVRLQAGKKGISFIEGMRLLAGVPTSFKENQEEEREQGWESVHAGKSLHKLLQQLRDPSLLPVEKRWSDVKASLRTYQKEGIGWLWLLSHLGLGACLADDMGLGKTLQVLALLTAWKTLKKQQDVSPSLLIVPASLLGNWKEEARKFTPHLRIFFAHPSENTLGNLQQITDSKFFSSFDIVVTTYGMTSRYAWIKEKNWQLVILDEAQAIKNSGTQQARAVKNLRSFARIALTGTPVENRCFDLWSLFDFLNPGLLGSMTQFKEYMKTLQQSSHQYASLRKLISPYILRRMKTDPTIIADLPSKIETDTYCQLTQEQVRLYQGQIEHLKKHLEIKDPIRRKGLILQVLMALKQICNHPAQYTKSGEYLASASGKFIRLRQICEELAQRQEKALIFTQFSEIIPPLVEYLTTIFQSPGLFLDGSTPIKERKNLVREFQKDEGPSFFVLSLRAGGTGLTLTAASHVLHFDRWWNPAVENQATDRAFRIGQKKNVQVHTFITQGTVEENIHKMLAAKRLLAEELLQSSGAPEVTKMSDEELLRLVALDMTKTTYTQDE